MNRPEKLYGGDSGHLPAHKMRFYRDIHNLRVLDIGCGVGQAGRFLALTGNTVDGITFSDQEAKLAAPYNRHIQIIDLNDQHALQETPEPVYDAVLLGDILEHLAAPEFLLAAVRMKLGTNGRIYVSVPNIANIIPRLGLLAGKFNYEETGIMDNTHLRFFTAQSITRLIENAGFRIERMEYSNCNWNFLPGSIIGRLRLKGFHQAVKNILSMMMPGLLATQIMLIASVSDTDRPETQ